jgi:hypothetical protein
VLVVCIELRRHLLALRKRICCCSLKLCFVKSSAKRNKRNRTKEVDLGLYDQANKRIRRMPWQSEAKKDVAACEKLWGVGNER